MKKPCLLKHLRDSGCDTEEKLRAAAQIIHGTMRVNSAPPPFTFKEGYIYHG